MNLYNPVFATCNLFEMAFLKPEQVQMFKSNFSEVAEKRVIVW